MKNTALTHTDPRPENGSWLIQSSYEKYNFLVQLGVGPGSPSGSQKSQEKSREVPLSDKKML